MAEKRSLTFSRLLQEVNQGHAIRRSLYQTLEKQLGQDKKVIAFFTSFTFPVLIEDNDADMIEELLNNSNMNGRELILLLNSPGGDALAAERIVNICRTYSKNGFTVIIPKQAKSAATMICFGAKKICMSKTSELGPIDPQIVLYDERGRPASYKAAHEIIDSYNDLIEKANRTTGRIEPFLQQLARFDARDIRSIRSAIQLSENIAVTVLKSGMLKDVAPRNIKSRIKPFLDPRRTKVHGRPIYHDIAKKCGLDVEICSNDSEMWRTVWQIYVRLNYVASNMAAKVIESIDDSYYVAPPEHE